MGKNIKSYATIPTLHSPRKGREASQQKVSIHQPNKKWLNRTLLGSPIFKIYEQNFVF